MALYFYKALSKTGIHKSGSIDASSQEEVKTILTQQGLYPISIQTQSLKNKKTSPFSNLFQSKVTSKDLIFFTKQLGVLIRSGIPLLQSLELLHDQCNKPMPNIIQSLIDGIKEGSSLAQGLEKNPEAFSKMYVQLIKAGEATGKLESILERLTLFLERQEEINSKVKSAMILPAIQLGTIVVVVAAIMLLVVPNIKSMLTSIGQELPFATQLLISGSYILTNHYIMILAVLLCLAFLFDYFARSKRGRYIIDSTILKIPLINFFAKTRAIVQFSNTLGMLLESGVNLSTALDIVCNIIDNSILLQTLTEAKDKIIKQGKITPFLKETKLFPPMALYLINTGEQTGKLDSMLLVVAKNYETELTEIIDAITDNIPTIMTLVMACVVGFIMWAVMGPILNMYNLSGL